MAMTMPADTGRRPPLGARLLRLFFPGSSWKRQQAVIKNDWEAPAMPSPLLSLVQAFQSLMARQQQLDRMELEAPPDERPRIEGWGEMNLEALDHLQRTIAAVPADDHQGAVIQVLIALERVAAIRDQTDKRDLDDQLAVLQQLLRSALPVLASAADVDLGTYGAKRYTSDSSDWPFFMPGKSVESQSRSD